MCPLELGGPLVFKLMTDIVLDVEDSALRSMTQSPQTMRLKDIPGDNVATAVSYLKGALMEYTKSIYFASKRNWSVLASSFTDYLNTAESEYRTLYRAGKWTKSKADPDSGFYAGNSTNDTPRPDGDVNERNMSMVGAGEERGLGLGRGRGHRGSRGGRGRGRSFQRKR